MNRHFRLAGFLFFLLIDPAYSCGVTSNCIIDERHYRIRMPDNVPDNEKVGAIVYAHGFGGSARGIMNNSSMARLSNELGVAIIATKSAAADWSIPGAPSKVTFDGVDELAYFDKVAQDAKRRFPIDEHRLMATGFSAGGMMVWNLVCFRSELFAAFAPMAGTFWRPEPMNCSSPPANVVHIHGTSDRTVPLEGRKVMDTHQGNVSDVLEMYESYGGYRFAGKSTTGNLSCETSQNASGHVLSFCTFPGGHTFKSDFVKQAWQIFERAGKL